MLRDGRIDAIELYSGIFVSDKLSPSRGGINSEDKETYFREAARVFKENLNVPCPLLVLFQFITPMSH